MSGQWKRLVVALGVFLVAIILVQRLTKSSNAERIGVILATSGSADFIGKPEEEILRALDNDRSRLDVAHLGGRTEIVIRDSGSDPKRALQLFEYFVNDPGFVAILGPSTSGESIAVAERAEALGEVPVLSLAASRQIVVDERTGAVRRWVFKFAQNDSLAAGRLLREMVRTGKKTVALLYSNDGFGKSGAEEFREALRSGGGPRLTYDQPFPSALDQPEPVTAGVPAVDAILIWGTAPGPSLLVKTLRRARNPAQVYLSHGNATEEFITSTGPASEGAIVVGSRVFLAQYLKPDRPEDESIINFDRYWRERFGTGPSHFGGHARDAFEAVQTCIAQGAHSRKEVRDKLESMNIFYGVTGTFRFSQGDHAGLTSDAFATYRIQGGKFVPIEAP